MVWEFPRHQVQQQNALNAQLKNNWDIYWGVFTCKRGGEAKIIVHSSVCNIYCKVLLLGFQNYSSAHAVRSNCPSLHVEHTAPSPLLPFWRPAFPFRRQSPPWWLNKPQLFLAFLAINEEKSCGSIAPFSYYSSPASLPFATVCCGFFVMSISVHLSFSSFVCPRLLPEERSADLLPAGRPGDRPGHSPAGALLLPPGFAHQLREKET